MKKIKLLFCIGFLTLNSPLAFGQSWDWGRQGSDVSQGFSEGLAVATNSLGESVFTGEFYDSIQFGSYWLSDYYHGLYPYYEAFFVKCDKYGNVRWAVQTYQNSKGQTSNITGWSVAADNLGNFYVTGNFSDTIRLGSYILKTSNNTFEAEDIFIVKLDSAGNVVWVNQPANINSYGAGYAITIDHSGNIYAAGIFKDTVVFGNNILYSRSGTQSVFLVKYNPAGKVIWAKQATTSSIANGYGVTTDKYNNIYITGDFTDSLSFGNRYLYTQAASDIFLTKYDSNGNVKWSRQSKSIVGIPKGSIATSVITDKGGYPYITGCFSDTVNFGTHRLHYEFQNIFLTKYDTAGNVVWAQAPTVMDTNVWGAYSLASDKRNLIYMSGGGGSYYPSIQFGTLHLSCNYASDPAIIVVFDTSGNALCGSILKTGGEDNNSVSVDSTGEYVNFGSDMDNKEEIVGPDTFINWGSIESAFVTRWQPCEDLPTGINAIPLENKLSLFPNPNNGQFTIQANSQQSTGADHIEIYNMLGAKVYNATLKQVQGDNTINLSSQPNGIYLYRVMNENGGLIGEGKLIIAH